MPVPLSLDPGHRDPESPLFNGCYHCGKPDRPSPCRACQQEQERAEAEQKQIEHEIKKREMARAFIETGDSPPPDETQLPRELEIELEHRAESAYHALQQYA